MADELVSEGVLTKTGTNSYRFPSLLIRTITLGAVMSQKPQQSQIPIQNDNLLIKELIK